jgi:Kef-type K+ transport system membrane component KefB
VRYSPAFCSGPTLLGDTLSSALFPDDVRPLLTALANVGVAIFMFLVGLELQRSVLHGNSRVAVTVSVSSIVFPGVLGACLALYLLRNHPAERQLDFLLFLGAAMSVTAFPVLARILVDRGMLRTVLGGLALTCAAVDDFLAWSMLAMVVMIGNGETGGWSLALFPAYVTIMVFVVRPLLRRVPAGTGCTGYGQLTILVAGALVSGAITEWIGLHYIFGAFLFGVVVRPANKARLRQLMSRQVGDFNSTLLLPVFFIVAGLQVDLSEIGWVGLGELGLVLLVAIGGKFGGAFAGARLHRLPVRKSLVIATLMNTRGLTELIILNVGLEIGVLDRSLYSIMVTMAVITTVMTGPLLRLFYPRPMVERDQAVEADLVTEPATHP